jgi:hypothetical protein
VRENNEMGEARMEARRLIKGSVTVMEAREGGDSERARR